MAGTVELTRSDGEPVCRARVAKSFAARFRGLMGVARLEPPDGLLLPRTGSVHTHFMRFPIDVVFLDSEQRIVSIAKALRPWRMARAKGANSVLELAAGECERLELAEGATLLDASAAGSSSPRDRDRTRSRPSLDQVADEDGDLAEERLDRPAH